MRDVISRGVLPAATTSRLSKARQPIRPAPRYRREERAGLRVYCKVNWASLLWTMDITGDCGSKWPFSNLEPLRLMAARVRVDAPNFRHGSCRTAVRPGESGLLNRQEHSLIMVQIDLTGTPRRAIARGNSAMSGRWSFSTISTKIRSSAISYDVHT